MTSVRGKAKEETETERGRQDKLPPWVKWSWWPHWEEGIWRNVWWGRWKLARHTSPGTHGIQGRHSEEKEEQVQRPWDRRVPGICDEQQGAWVLWDLRGEMPGRRHLWLSLSVNTEREVWGGNTSLGATGLYIILRGMGLNEITIIFLKIFN